VKGVEFIRYRMSYIILRCRRFNIIILTVHAPTMDKSGDTKDNFCEELQHVFY